MFSTIWEIYTSQLYPFYTNTNVGIVAGSRMASTYMRSSAQLKSVVLKITAKMVTISALTTFLLAKSAISHAWALCTKQRQCLYARRGEARCGGGTKDEKNYKAVYMRFCS